MASALTIPRAEYPLPSPGIEQILGGPVSSRRLNVVCVGAHPDDPETGCGGTLAKLASEGHQVAIVYLTRGEAGLKDSDCITASRLRTAEALAACDLLGVRAVFANQIDGQTSTEKKRAQQFTALLASLEPDIVFTHCLSTRTVITVMRLN
jgi:LmbE family N-acetylglucosaminyl deacetylase